MSTSAAQPVAKNKIDAPMVKAVHHIKRMRGATQAHLLQCSDGHFYVVKFRNNPQHLRVLANEMLATVLAECVGLPVPTRAIVEVGKELIHDTPALSIQLDHLIIPCESGAHFGSRCVVSPLEGQVFDHLATGMLARLRNPETFAGILAVDKWTCNTDARQATFWRLSREKKFNVTFIDQGCCFNTGDWTFPDGALRGVYAENDVYENVRSWDSFEPWLSRIEGMPESTVWRAAGIIPPEWYGSNWTALEKLALSLLERRGKVRDLIKSFGMSQQQPFPNWNIQDISVQHKRAGSDEKMDPAKNLEIIPLGSHLQPVRNSTVKNVDQPFAEKTGDILRKLWQALDQSVDPIVITNRMGIIEYVNPGFEILTGYSKSEALGNSLRILRSEKEAPEVYEMMWQTVVSGNTFCGTVVNQKRNGEPFSVEKTITPLRDNAGDITHLISTDRDITEQCKLELQLLQAHKMDSIGRLASGVAHDVNNLLMVISSYAEPMLDSLSTNHPLLRNVQEIMGASRRGADLTRQLLVFGRKQGQTLQLLALNSVIDEISRMLLRLIGEDIEFVFVPGAHLGIVKADPVQIVQVLMNLATNARDAMPQGGRLTIETAAIKLDEAYVQKDAVVPAGDYILLTAIDSGVGIAPQHLPEIFEPFYTTKEESEGTGLGLATVYSIVEQSGGYLWVDSEPSMGTTFKIYLPSVQTESRELLHPAPVGKVIPHGCETILLVEDYSAVRESAREFLLLNGYVVLEAADGEDALCMAAEFRGPIDLLITDVVMPRMGGAKLAERLRAARPDLKVLFISGYVENTGTRHEAILSASFLSKPFSLGTLAHRIREIIEVGL